MSRHLLRPSLKQFMHHLQEAASAAISYFDFASADVTFTAGAAKRAAPGPFAAAPVIQGDGNNADANTDDVLSLARGTQVSGYFYPTFDGYQGSVVVWFTPEFAYDQYDGAGDHYVWYISSNYFLAYEYDNDRYNLTIGGQTLNVSSNVAAGTTYLLTARWDCDVTLDGTNYLCLSINDTHSFGATSAPTAAAPDATIYVGTNGTTGAASGIVEGLTVYRRPLYDGTYGIDAGNGDEINLIYAAGSGKDPTEITGSWDVVFCLPTNSTAGPLVTGEGEAWTHPHASNVLGDWHAMTAYAASDWGDEGTPVVPYSLAFDGSTTSVNCGSDASLDDLPAGDFTVEGWIRANVDSTSSYIAMKGTSWYLRVYSLTGIHGFVAWDSSAAAISDVTHVVNDNKWHHVAMTSTLSDKKVRIYVDGIFVGTSGAGVGNYTSDSASNLYVGSYGGAGGRYEGDIAWVRISDSIRYTDTFVPPSRLNPPAADANAVAQYNFRDGSGTTLTDETANSNDGTISNGEWNTVADMSTDALGARVYAGGYTIGADAAAEGITQTLTGLDAGQNYVARPVISYEDARAQPIIRVYDETNSANIVDFAGPWLNGVHDGGDGESALADSSAPYWPASLVGGTIYNITDGSSGTITACGTTITATLAGGTDNDWDDDDVYMIVPPARWVWTEPFTWELPTTARNGSAADCVSMSVQVLNGNDEGVFYLHQCEVLENLIDNPSLETGAGDPWIPDGWTTNFDATEAVQETVDVHSGSSAFSTDGVLDTGEIIKRDSGAAISAGAYVDTGLFYKLLDSANPIQLEYWANANYLQATHAANTKLYSMVWAHASRVIWSSSAYFAMTIKMQNPPNDFICDDFYAYALTPVSLTVTPASEANSTESTGLRVDGDDEATQTIANLTATSGHIRTGATPRHDAADAVKFGNSAAYILEAYGAADNYIRAYWSAANTVTLAFNDGGGEHTDTWDATGEIDADTTYQFALDYSATEMTLSLDGTVKATITTAINFATVPTDIYWGHAQDGTKQADASFSAPA